MLEKNRGSIADSPEVFDCDDHAAAFADAQEEKGPKFTILECLSILRKNIGLRIRNSLSFLPRLALLSRS